MTGPINCDTWMIPSSSEKVVVLPLGKLEIVADH